MSDVTLKRIEPSTNCFRFYRLAVEPNLFGDYSLVIHWGRLGRFGRFRIASSGPREDVEALAMRAARRKLARGYQSDA
jgi:predicted DNA-binding WGR domain protein